MLAGDLACKVARIPAVVSARYYETTGKGAGRGSARRRRRGLRDPRPDVDAIIPCGHNGAAGLFNLPCWADERTKGPLCVPALGPVGDSLEDLT